MYWSISIWCAIIFTVEKLAVMRSQASLLHHPEMHLGQINCFYTTLTRTAKLRHTYPGIFLTLVSWNQGSVGIFCVIAWERCCAVIPWVAKAS